MKFSTIQSLNFRNFSPQLTQIECVQSKRLPYLQLIGVKASAAAEQRERILAALSVSGYRLPRNRVTIQFRGDSGDDHSGTDFAVALAILACMGEFSSTQLIETVASGRLGLNGRLDSTWPTMLLSQFGASTFRYLGPWHLESPLPSATPIFSLSEAAVFLRTGVVPRVSKEASSSAIGHPHPSWGLTPANLNLLQAVLLAKIPILTNESGLICLLEGAKALVDSPTREEWSFWDYLFRLNRQSLQAWPPLLVMESERKSQKKLVLPSSALSKQGLLKISLSPNTILQNLGGLPCEFSGLVVFHLVPCSRCRQTVDDCLCLGVVARNKFRYQLSRIPFLDLRALTSSGADPIDWGRAKHRFQTASKKKPVKDWSTQALAAGVSLRPETKVLWQRLAEAFHMLQFDGSQIGQQAALAARFYFDSDLGRLSANDSIPFVNSTPIPNVFSESPVSTSSTRTTLP